MPLQDADRAAGWASTSARSKARADAVAPVIRSLQADGVTTLRGLASALSERGIKTPNGSSIWAPTQVQRVLKMMKQG